jgi:hypothetical protein
MDHEPNLTDLRLALADKIQTRQRWHENRIELSVVELHALVIGILRDEMRLRQFENSAAVDA